jgi:hypothetical protein
MFFSIGNFFLYYRFQNTYERNESHSSENCHAKILVLESESENSNNNNNNISESEYESEKKIRIHNTGQGISFSKYDEIIKRPTTF